MNLDYYDLPFEMVKTATTIIIALVVAAYSVGRYARETEAKTRKALRELVREELRRDE